LWTEDLALSLDRTRPRPRGCYNSLDFEDEYENDDEDDPNRRLLNTLVIKSIGIQSEYLPAKLNSTTP